MARNTPLRWCRARLVNHADLVSKLGLGADASDEAVVSAAVDRWGGDTPDHLQGSFAYAVDDVAGTTIARDALGVMPAFWARDGSGALHISDSLEELHDIDGVDLATDEVYIAADSLRWPGLVVDRTERRGIHRVPPGSVTHVSAHGATTTHWWQPHTTPRVRRISIEEAARELHDLLVAVVDDHMTTIHRRRSGTTPAAVSSHCSGGMDSTAISYLAADALEREGQRLRSIVSWSPDRKFPGTDSEFVQTSEFDERDLVDELARDLRTSAWFGPAVGAEAPWAADVESSRLPRVSVLRETWVAPAMVDQGVSHVLSGWGGDEFVSFNGRGTNRELVRRLRLGALRSGYSDRRRRGVPPLRAAFRTLSPGLPVWVPVGRQRESERDRARRDAREAVAAQFPDLASRGRAHDRALRRASGSRAMQLLLIEHGHLSRRTDAWHQIGLRFGYEYVYPLLDRRLVEWALSMPSEVYRDGEHSRRVFRLALAGIVPDAITKSAKADPVLFAFIAAHRP
jgi:asparagine synthase (glutamine-hydrolysing)